MPRVYVGNLAGSVTSEDLLTLFSRAGEVKNALAISDRTSSVCRGFGFVDMMEAEDVATAIQMLDHAELNGQCIQIEPDVPRPEHVAGKTSKRRHPVLRS
ncbi:MAG: RNA recognition motif domain-containing protein [Candidatus Binataceae bacterium]